MSFKKIEAYSDVSEYLRRTNNDSTSVFTILSYLEKYKDVFSKESFEQLLQYQFQDYTIDLKPDFKLSDCKVYLLVLKEQDALKDFITKNLALERIQYSKSFITSPFFFIKKEDGTLRLVQDYRKLNKDTIKNKYPLLLIQELLNKVKDSKYFTKLNVCQGYYNI